MNLTASAKHTAAAMKGEAGATAKRKRKRKQPPASRKKMLDEFLRKQV